MAMQISLAPLGLRGGVSRVRRTPACVRCEFWGSPAPKRARTQAHDTATYRKSQPPSSSSSASVLANRQRRPTPSSAPPSSPPPPSRPSTTMPRVLIAPSVLAADMGNLNEECKRMITAGADWLHMDVMDGHFVPNLVLGAPPLSSVHKAVPGIFMDCHMMVTEPGRWIKDIAEAGGSSYTFHLEATYDPLDIVRKIKSAGMRAAVAINPGTPTSEISNELGESVDMILVMTVWPGWGGQRFMRECMPKVAELRARFPNLDIEVDGGVGPKTIEHCANAGANVLVAGSAIFGAEDPKEVISFLRQKCEEAQERIKSEREQILFDPNSAVDEEEGEDLIALEGRRSRAMTPLSHPRAYIRNLALRRDSTTSTDGKPNMRTGYGVPTPSASRRNSENMPVLAQFNGAVGMTPMDHTED